MKTLPAVTLLIVLLLFFCACQGDFSQHQAAAPETIGAEQIMEMIRRAEESALAAESEADPPKASTEAAESTAVPSTAEAAESTAMSSTAEADGTVYWTAGGEVWHTDPGCGSLSGARETFSGTRDAAEAAGKSRACKRCS